MSTPDKTPDSAKPEAIDQAPPVSGKPASPPSPKKALPKEALPKEALPKEIGGAEGPEPTRYGDWQHKGRVTDF
jgi:hypothetical protein